jgi:prepilin-type N-terminal cleavage/methylation domain-containing protein
MLQQRGGHSEDDSKQGFTIIEVVLVLAIAGLIFLMVFLAIGAAQRAQRDQLRKNQLGTLKSNIDNWRVNHKGNVIDTETEAENLMMTYFDGRTI